MGRRGTTPRSTLFSRERPSVLHVSSPPVTRVFLPPDLPASVAEAAAKSVIDLPAFGLALGMSLCTPRCRNDRS